MRLASKGLHALVLRAPPVKVAAFAGFLIWGVGNLLLSFQAPHAATRLPLLIRSASRDLARQTGR